jgi:hypothetical protein
LVAAVQVAQAIQVMAFLVQILFLTPLHRLVVVAVAV